MRPRISRIPKSILHARFECVEVDPGSSFAFVQHAIAWLANCARADRIPAT
jgi:hypothetical protein